MLDVLIPQFEKEPGYKVKTAAVGSGAAIEMGQTLTVTNQKSGYTLSGKTTYLAQKQNLKLVIMVKGDKNLMYNSCLFW